MSDTPRTDEAFAVQGEVTFQRKQYVMADFARQLERENADLKKRLEASNGWDDYNAIKALQAENAALREAIEDARQWLASRAVAFDVQERLERVISPRTEAQP